jgi:hypothetical protein
MRQEIRLLSEKLKVINIILFFFFNNAKVIPPISYPVASKILITDITDFEFHTPQTTCYYACENQIETSNISCCQIK